MARDDIHLKKTREVTPSARGCEDCLKTGDRWVHLRLPYPAATSAAAGPGPAQNAYVSPAVTTALGYHGRL